MHFISNATGTNKPTPQEYIASEYLPYPNVFQLGRGSPYGSTGEIIIPFKNEAANFMFLPQSICFFGTFAQTRLSLLPTGSQIFMIPCAFSGSGFVYQKLYNGGTYSWSTSFIPSSSNDINLCFDMIRRVHIAQHLWPNATIKALLYHQGETDVNNMNYQQQLIAMFQYTRNALSLPRLPIIVGSLLLSWRNSVVEPARSSTTDRVNNILMNLSKLMNNDLYVASVNMDDIGQVDMNVDQLHVHYNATSQRIMGKRYCDALSMILAAETVRNNPNLFKKSIKIKSLSLTSSNRNIPVKHMLGIGINYKNTRYQLEGCENDIENVKKLLSDKHGYTDFTIYTDDTPLKPIKAVIESGIKNSIAQSQCGDTIFIDYSGHGSTIRRKMNEMEKAQTPMYDSTIVPLDFLSNGMLEDNDLYQMIIMGAVSQQKNIKVRVLLDCCHSATTMDYVIFIILIITVPSLSMNKNVPLIKIWI